MKISIRKKKLSNGTYSLYLDYYYRGERQYEFLELRLINEKEADRETLQIAENIRAKRLIEWQRKQHAFKPPTKLRENFVAYFENIVNEKPSDRSSWHCTLKKVKTFTNGHLSFLEIDEEWLRHLQKFLLSEVSAITAWHYYSNVKQALSRAVREKILPEDPSKNIPSIKKPDIQREYLTFEEIEKLIKARCPNVNVREAFLFSCFTGLRYSDILNLKWQNIIDGVLEFRQRKTGIMEYLPLSKTAQDILDSKRGDEHKEDDSVFNLPSKYSVWNNIKIWIGNAGINKRVSFHTARHTFATLSLTSGVDLYTVSKLLGHKDISTTQIYAKIIDSRKREAVDLLPVINFNEV
jgi:integrase